MKKISIGTVVNWKKEGVYGMIVGYWSDKLNEYYQVMGACGECWYIPRNEVTLNK